MIWNDEFSESEINSDKWNFEIGTGNWGWGNNEAQYYTSDSENAYIDDGKLVIQAVNENFGGMNYTSARMTTKNKGDWKYGKLEIRAKLPSGTGTWPAIWMLPTEGVYGGWPESGEIDIMEQNGSNKQILYGTFHWADAGGQAASYGLTKDISSLNISDVTSNFHLYSLLWSSASIKVYVDNLLIAELANTSEVPFDNPHYILLNLAMGGNLGGDIPQNFNKGQMEIDYVRVYQ